MLAPGRRMTHASVSTLLARLTHKGLVTREKGSVGKAFVFRATVERNPIQRQLVGDLLDRVFGGSGIALISTLLESRRPSARELDELSTLVQELRSRKSRSASVTARRCLETVGGRLRPDEWSIRCPAGVVDRGRLGDRLVAGPAMSTEPNSMRSAADQRRVYSPTIQRPGDHTAAETAAAPAAQRFGHGSLRLWPDRAEKTCIAAPNLENRFGR